MTTIEESRKFLTSMNAVGSKILGGLGGLLAVYATGEPVAGPLTAPFVAHQLEKGGKELINRHLTSRQEMRVGAAYVLAYSEIADRLDKGESPRADNFFSSSENERSAASELTEAALAAAKDAAEERKVPFIAYLLAGVFFDKRLDRSTAHYLISSAERLSYRSFAILTVVGGGDCLENEDCNKEDVVNADGVFSETIGLMQSGFVVAKDNADADTLNVVFGGGDVLPDKLYLSELGQVFFDLMRLTSMRMQDEVRANVRRAFSRRHKGSATQVKLDAGEF